MWAPEAFIGGCERVPCDAAFGSGASGVFVKDVFGDLAENILHCAVGVFLIVETQDGSDVATKTSEISCSSACRLE